MKIPLANAICFAAVFLELSSCSLNRVIGSEPMETDHELVEPTQERDFLADFLLERQKSMTQIDFVTMLAEQIQNGMDLQTILLCKEYNENPIFRAAKHCHMDVLRFLVRYGDNYFLGSENTSKDWVFIIQKILNYSILLNSYEVFEHVFNHCAVVNLNFLASYNYILSCAESMFRKMTANFDTIDFYMLKKLVDCSTEKYGAKGHAVLAQYSHTLELIFALSTQYPQVVGSPEIQKLLLYLLDEGFCHSKSPLSLSMIGFHPSYIPILESYNVTVDDEDLFGNNTLMLSLQMPNYRRRVPQIQMLIQRSQNLNTINEGGHTALSIALIPIPRDSFSFPIKYYWELHAQSTIVGCLLSAGASPVVDRIFCRLDRQKCNWESTTKTMDLFNVVPDLLGNPLLTRTIQHWIRANRLFGHYPLIMSLDCDKLHIELSDRLFWESVEMWNPSSKANEELLVQVRMFWDFLDAKSQKANLEKLSSLKGIDIKRQASCRSLSVLLMIVSTLKVWPLTFVPTKTNAYLANFEVSQTPEIGEYEEFIIEKALQGPHNTMLIKYCSQRK
jgi:hypothetical protein